MYGNLLGDCRGEVFRGLGLDRVFKEMVKRADKEVMALLNFLRRAVLVFFHLAPKYGNWSYSRRGCRIVDEMNLQKTEREKMKNLSHFTACVYVLACLVPSICLSADAIDFPKRDVPPSKSVCPKAVQERLDGRGVMDRFPEHVNAIKQNLVNASLASKNLKIFIDFSNYVLDAREHICSGIFKFNFSVKKDIESIAKGEVSCSSIEELKIRAATAEAGAENLVKRIDDSLHWALGNHQWAVTFIKLNTENYEKTNKHSYMKRWRNIPLNGVEKEMELFARQDEKGAIYHDAIYPLMAAKNDMMQKVVTFREWRSKLAQITGCGKAGPRGISK